MKNKIKRYITSVWGGEILLLLILITMISISLYQVFTSDLGKLGVTQFDALEKPDKYIKSLICYESKELSQYIYDVSDNLTNLERLREENRYIFEKDLSENQLFYALVNKNTREFITNDFKLRNYISASNHNGISIEDTVNLYLNNENRIGIQNDNVNEFNYYVENSKENIDKKQLSNYMEFYYDYKDSYSNIIKTESITAKFIIVGFVLILILLVKILLNIMFNKENIHLDIRVLHRLVYVLVYGFKYKTTRNKIIVSLSGAVGVILAYLYLVAGIRNQNILITFLSKYPFKGTLILVLIPVICVIYSLKKSLDITIINDGLKKLNSGDLEYNLGDIGEREVKELVQNINQIKEGYKIALNEKIKNEKLKTELISNVSHDLKTPLTSIINYVNILGDSNITEEERREYLEILEQKSRRLKILIEDLFEVSKLNSGKMKISKINLDIVSLVHQGVGEYSNLYEEKNIEFKVTSNNDEIFVNLDGKLMSRVFENIIINALKYSLNNTRVYIDIQETTDTVKIAFKNIANYEMNFNTDEIFERFQRADRSRNSQVEGSGIGLAITKSIIELHNGNIKIEVEGDMFKIYMEIPKK